MTIVERLRGPAPHMIGPLMDEAADEIERLNGLLEWHDTTVPEILADNERLRAALEDAVETLEAMNLHGDNPLYNRLRAALENKS